MYDRFTDRARKVMQLANQEAQRRNHEYIGTEHLLVALAKDDGVAGRVLAALGLTLQSVREQIDNRIPDGPEMVAMGKLPQTPRAKKVIEYAFEAARELQHNFLGTEHLLLGLCRESEGIAAEVLRSCGIDADVVKRELANVAPATADEAKVVEKLTAAFGIGQVSTYSVLACGLHHKVSASGPPEYKNGVLSFSLGARRVAAFRDWSFWQESGGNGWMVTNVELAK